MNEETKEAATTLTDKAIEWADKLEAAVVDVAPVAWDLALATARVEALQVVIYGLFGVFVGLIAMIYCVKALMKLFKEDNGMSGDVEGFVFGTAFLSGIVGVIGFLTCIFDLLNALAWVGLFYPEIWLVHNIMS